MRYLIRWDVAQRRSHSNKEAKEEKVAVGESQAGFKLGIVT